MTNLLLLADASWWQWLLWLLGFDVEGVPDTYERGLAFPLSSFWVFLALFAAVVICAGVFYLYVTDIKTCPLWVKLVSASLRCLVLLLLAVLLLGPFVDSFSETKTPSVIVVLRDKSQSMNVRDKYLDKDAAAAAAGVDPAGEGASEAIARIQQEQPSRREVFNRHVAEARLLEKLRRRGQVRVIDFAEQVERGETFSVYDESEHRDNAGAAGAPSLALSEEQVEGRATDLHQAIRESLAEDRLAAIVLFSDGQHTAVSDPLAASRQARERKVPLLVVGLGDPSRDVNIAVTDVYVRPEAWPGEPFEIEALFYSQGIGDGGSDATKLGVTLFREDAEGGSPEIVEQRDVEIPPEGGRVSETFTERLTDPGKYRYRVEIASVAGERTTDDNQRQSATVEVLDEQKVKVLLIAGAPSWDYRMVERLLERDDSITVSAWLQTLDQDRAQAGNEPIVELPRTPAELNEYNVVMMFDPNPDEFDKEWLDMLAQFVEKQGGGFLYMAGPKYSGGFVTGNRTGQIRDLLPVRFGDLAAIDVVPLIESNRQEWQARFVPANIQHPIISFVPQTQANEGILQSLPGIFWSFPAVGEKKTAQVLLEHSDPSLRGPEGPRPLLVAGRAGVGNSVYIGFNGTWRWRRAGRQAEFFDRFWVQTVRYLVESRTLRGKRRGYVQTDRERYDLGDRIQLTARLRTIDSQPLEADEVQASLVSGEDPPIPLVLTPVANQPGDFETSLVGRHLGVNTVRVSLPGGESLGDVEPASFTVEIPQVEQNEVRLNEELLKNLAMDPEKVTENPEYYFRVDQLDQIPGKIPDAGVTDRLHQPRDMYWEWGEVVYKRDLSAPFTLGSESEDWSARRQLYIELTRGGLIASVLLISVVLLLGTEWGLRKGFKLL